MANWLVWQRHPTMTNKVVPFGSQTSHSGRGPDDPDLPARVARLEESLQRVEASLGRLETTSQTASEQFTDMKKHLVRMDESQRRTEVDMAELKGRLKGVEDRFSMLPTTLQLLGFAVAIFVAAGVFRFFEPRPLVYAPPPVSAPRGSQVK